MTRAVWGAVLVVIVGALTVAGFVVIMSAPGRCERAGGTWTADITSRVGGVCVRSDGVVIHP